MRRLIALLVLLTGCDLYWNQGDDDCKYYDYGGADIQPANQLRNPMTGACEYTYGGGYGCDDPCSPCPATGAPPEAIPDWGSCYGHCNALAESACLSEPGCLATYDEKTFKNLPPTDAVFRGCFETAPSGPISTGTCIGLDAQSCSRHDNCSMYYGESNTVTGGFTRCVAEASANGCTNVDCGANYHCENHCADPANSGTECGAVCVPDGDICANVDCGPGYACAETCIQPGPTHVGQCFGTCVMQTACAMLTTEAACVARGDCTSVYNGEDCECTPNGACTCQILTYDRCEAH